MEMSALYCLAWSAVILVLFDSVNGESCVFSTPCSCTGSKFGVDLSRLMQDRGEPLTYEKKVGSKVVATYYLNPCGHSLAIPDCKELASAAGCQFQVGTAYGIASTTGYSAHGDPSLGTVQFYYSFTSDKERKSILSVSCNRDMEGFFYFEKEDPKLTYNFMLQTRYACPPSPGSGSGGGLSLGTILLIILFVVIVVYCLGGYLFLKFVRKAEGLEVIPQYEFWKDLPFLIKDGVVFACQLCRGKSTYEKI